MGNTAKGTVGGAGALVKDRRKKLEITSLLTCPCPLVPASILIQNGMIPDAGGHGKGAQGAQ